MPVVADLQTDLSDDLERILTEYRGKWVATTRTRLLAVGDTQQEVLAHKNVKLARSPFVFRVPDESARGYFF